MRGDGEGVEVPWRALAVWGCSSVLAMVWYHIFKPGQQQTTECNE